MTDEMNDVFDIRQMSEHDLISDELMWLTLNRLQPKRVLESDFIKQHDVERVERNDQLLLIMTRLHNKHGGFQAFWSGTEIDRTFFIVGNKSKKAYTKRYKPSFPNHGYSESGPE
jgi:hypothetical protein